jgi:hypothetical protein
MLTMMQYYGMDPHMLRFVESACVVREDEEFVSEIRRRRQIGY